MMRARDWPAPPPPTRQARLRAALHHCTDCGHPEVVHYLRTVSTTPLQRVRACYLCGWCHQCALAVLHNHPRWPDG